MRGTQSDDVSHDCNMMKLGNADEIESHLKILVVFFA